MSAVVLARPFDGSGTTSELMQSVQAFGGDEIELIDADGPAVRAFEDQAMAHFTWRRLVQVYGWTGDARLGQLRDVAMMMAFLLYGAEGRPSLALVDAGQAAHSALGRTVSDRLRLTTPMLAYRRLLLPLTGRAGRMSARHPESTMFLEDEPSEIRRKFLTATTGGQPTAQQQHATGGDPTRCPVFETIELLCDDERVTRALGRCVSGEALCGSCKGEHVEEIVGALDRHRRKSGVGRQAIAATSPAAVSALRQCATSLHRPPPRTPDRLEHLVAAWVGVDAEQVVVSNGATEAMSWVIDEQAGLEAVVAGAPSFELYEQLARRAGIPYQTARWDGSTGRHHLDAFRAALERSAVCFLDSPHTVSGTPTSLREVLDLLIPAPERRAKLVVDNVYGEFMQTPMTLSSALVEHYDALVVCRSLSKAHCLLGARIGYAVTNAAYADRLRRHRLPYAVTSATLAAAEAAVLDTETVRRNVSASHAARAAVTRVLHQLGLRYLKTDANFLLIDLAEHRDRIVDVLRARRVRFRDGERWRLPTMIQVHLIDEPTVAPLIEALAAAPCVDTPHGRQERAHDRSTHADGRPTHRETASRSLRRQHRQPGEDAHPVRELLHHR